MFAGFASEGDLASALVGVIGLLRICCSDVVVWSQDLITAVGKDFSISLEFVSWSKSKLQCKRIQGSFVYFIFALLRIFALNVL